MNKQKPKKPIDYCACGHPQSYPIPHEHSKEREWFNNGRKQTISQILQKIQNLERESGIFTKNFVRFPIKDWKHVIGWEIKQLEKEGSS